MPRGMISVTLKNRIPAYMAAADKRMTAAVKETVIEIEQDVKGGPHAAPIDTGNLRRSYHHEMTGRYEGTVGNDMGVAEYAIYVELGTSKMAAQPHLTPAAEAAQPRFLDRLGKALRGK